MIEWESPSHSQQLPLQWRDILVCLCLWTVVVWAHRERRGYSPYTRSLFEAPMRPMTNTLWLHTHTATRVIVHHIGAVTAWLCDRRKGSTWAPYFEFSQFGRNHLKSGRVFNIKNVTWLKTLCAIFKYFACQYASSIQLWDDLFSQYGICLILKRL